MLKYQDEVSAKSLQLIRAKIRKGGYPNPVHTLFEKAVPGPDPTVQTALYWRSHPEDFSSLCQVIGTDTPALLAIGVPVDLISQQLYQHHLVALPFWQSNGACQEHPNIDVLELIPHQYALVRCTRCQLVLRLVP